MISSLRRLLNRRTERLDGFRYDPFFADPGVVEDDYRRMNPRRN